MAAHQGSYSWPKHWQRTIARIEAKVDTETNRYVYTVHVRNPESLVWESESPFGARPALALGTVDFDTVEELDQWAAMVDRLDN